MAEVFPTIKNSGKLDAIFCQQRSKHEQYALRKQRNST